MTIKEIAKVVHNLQSVFCASIGDNTVPSWDEASEEMRNTTIEGVYALLDEPEAGPGRSHENWMQRKIESGWIFGPNKDADKKTHPSLVPFSELSWNDQFKDILFVQTVRELQQHWC